MKFLPMVPYVHSKPALAFQKNVKGYIPSPVVARVVRNRLLLVVGKLGRRMQPADG